MSKIFFILALVFLILGLIFLGLEVLHVKPFHLPGDIVIKKGNFVFYFPITTSIVLSILFSIVLFLLK